MRTLILIILITGIIFTAGYIGQCGKSIIENHINKINLIK